MIDQQQPSEPEIPQEPQSNDHFLEDLAAATGLFNPAMLVEELQELERLNTAAPLEEEEAAMLHKAKEATTTTPGPEDLP